MQHAVSPGVSARSASPRQRLRWPEIALMLAAGGLHALALAPVPLGGLQLLALALLVARLQGRSARAAFLLGGAFGFTWMLGTCFWLFVSMHRYGHLPAWLAAAAVALLAASLALFVAVAAAGFARWNRPDVPVWRSAGLWALLWLAIELARGQWFTGFPWGASGYAHVDSVLALIAPWLGVYGLGAVAAAVAAWSGTFWGRASGSRRAWAGLPILLVLVLPAWRGPDFTLSTGRLSVTLLQGNVPQDEKFDFDRLPATLTWHVQALRAARSDLVVTPETAIALLPDQLPVGLWPALSEHFSTGAVHALVGVPLGDFEHGYTNSVVGLAPGRAEYRYDKQHLVPFGEFIPFGFRWFVESMQIPLGDFARGPRNAPSFAVGAQRLAPNICYEDLFGEELALRWNGEHPAPTMLVNVSNIGWFGRTVAVDQHLHISRMRSLELQRPMLRATNTGATAVIDHRGLVTYRLPPHERGILIGEAEGRNGATPYAVWAARLGLWPLWGLVLLGCSGWVRANRRARAAVK